MWLEAIVSVCITDYFSFLANPYYIELAKTNQRGLTCHSLDKELLLFPSSSCTRRARSANLSSGAEYSEEIPARKPICFWHLNVG